MGGKEEESKNQKSGKKPSEAQNGQGKKESKTKFTVGDWIQNGRKIRRVTGWDVTKIKKDGKIRFTFVEPKGDTCEIYTDLKEKHYKKYIKLNGEGWEAKYQ